MTRSERERLLEQLHALSDHLEDVVEAELLAHLAAPNAPSYEEARAALIQEYGSAEKLDAAIAAIVNSPAAVTSLPSNVPNTALDAGGDQRSFSRRLSVDRSQSLSGSLRAPPRLKAGFSATKSREMAVAASDKEGSEPDLVSLPGFVFAGQSYAVVADKSGNVLIEGPLDPSWTLLVLGADAFELARDLGSVTTVRCVDLGQIDYEKFAYDETDALPEFR